jgi:integrase
VRLGRQHVKNGVARLKTEKTDEMVFVPIEAELERTLAAGPCGDLTFIAGPNRRPIVKKSFGAWFRKACIAAGIIGKTAHGLRKAAATLDAERGDSESELEAKYGWRGGKMASHYTRTANRERLAIGAAARARRDKI